MFLCKYRSIIRASCNRDPWCHLHTHFLDAIASKSSATSTFRWKGLKYQLLSAYNFGRFEITWGATKRYQPLILDISTTFIYFRKIIDTFAFSTDFTQSLSNRSSQFLASDNQFLCNRTFLFQVCIFQPLFSSFSFFWFCSTASNYFSCRHNTMGRKYQPIPHIRLIPERTVLLNLAQFNLPDSNPAVLMWLKLVWYHHSWWRTCFEQDGVKKVPHESKPSEKIVLKRLYAQEQRWRWFDDLTKIKLWP